MPPGLLRGSAWCNNALPCHSGMRQSVTGVLLPVPKRPTCLMTGQPVGWQEHPSVGPPSVSATRVSRSLHIGVRVARSTVPRSWELARQSHRRNVAARPALTGTARNRRSRSEVLAQRPRWPGMRRGVATTRSDGGDGNHRGQLCQGPRSVERGIASCRDSNNDGTFLG